MIRAGASVGAGGEEACRRQVGRVMKGVDFKKGLPTERET